MKGNQIFLIDAIGAVFSFTCLLIIYDFEELFGMPNQVLKSFLYIAISLSIYSFTCFFLKPKKWKNYLFIIAFLNALYCLFTLWQIVKNSQAITIFGYAYFSLEIFMILLLVFYELKLCRNKTNG